MFHVGAQLVDQADAASLVAGRVHQNPLAFGGQGTQAQIELGTTVAAERTERVTGQALGMHARQHGMPVAYLALDHRQVNMTGRAPEGAGVEFPGHRRQLDPRDFAHLDHGGACYPGKTR